jgi:hypothetical protein
MSPLKTRPDDAQAVVGYVNIKQLQQGLDYCGRVEAVRQTYHVFQAKSAYLVLSFARARDRKGSGYFNLIDAAAVEYVQERMGGHSGVTAKDVVQAGRRTKHITGRLQALNILYVMVALEQASIQKAGEHRQLFFSVRKARRAAA